MWGVQCAVSVGAAISCSLVSCHREGEEPDTVHPSGIRCGVFVNSGSGIRGEAYGGQPPVFYVASPSNSNSE